MSALLMLFFFMAIFSVLFATLIYTAEPGDYDSTRNQWVREDGSASPFESIPASVWWAIITMATVGYGDDVSAPPHPEPAASAVTHAGHATVTRRLRGGYAAVTRHSEPAARA